MSWQLISFRTKILLPFATIEKRKYKNEQEALKGMIKMKSTVANLDQP
jgi:hypothetical protein